MVRRERRMGGGGRRSSARIAALVATTVVASAGTGIWTTQPAAADEVTLRYTCTVAPVPSQDINVRLLWITPKSVVVDQPTPAIPIRGTTTVGPVVTRTLATLGASEVSGSVDATGNVNAPGGQTSATVHLIALPTPVPSSGPLTITATGTSPGLVFHQPGHATVTAGRTLAVHADMTNAQGGRPPISHADVTCLLRPDQMTTVASFEIVPATATPTTAAGGSSGPSAPGGRSGTGVSTGEQVISDSGGSASTPTESTTSAAPTTAPVTPTAPPALPAVSAPPTATRSAGSMTVLDSLLLAVILVVTAAISGSTVWWVMQRRCHRLHGSFR